MPKKERQSRERLKRVTAVGELREQIDWDRFAWALLQHARLLNEQAEQRLRNGRESEQ